MKSMLGWAKYLSVFALILLISACDSSSNGQSDPIPSVQVTPPPPKITMTVEPSLGLISGTAIDGGTGQMQPTADRNAKDNTLTKSMIAVSKADENINTFEQKKLLDTLWQGNITARDKPAVFDFMGFEISIQEIANSVSTNKHKAEVYLSVYLAIELEEQSKRTFLNNIGIVLDLPKGFPAYLEQQADQG